jgi:hypothetical protein
VVNDLSVPTNFLALVYPATDFETLTQRLGSIDLLPNTGL